jgi:hypothetical protein
MREMTAPVAPAAFSALLDSGQPAILRGLIADWPAVAQGRKSAAALLAYLAAFDTGRPVDAIMTPPEVQGRIFYNAAMDGFNFLRNRLPLSAVVEQVLRYASAPHPPSVAAQSALIQDCAPGFLQENRLALLPESVAPRLWLGNAITTPTHLDEWCNIGAVVAGRRRFTVFPPEQIANLYIGPLDFAPTGAPVSLVELARPDLARFPRFAAALDAAQVAELGPGDGIYLPPLWWHHVESLEPVNLLVNYWWFALLAGAPHRFSGFDALVHCLMAIRDLPEPGRRAWRALFDHYVFGDGAAIHGHIPAERLGMLGPLGREDRVRILAQILQRSADAAL